TARGRFGRTGTGGAGTLPRPHRRPGPEPSGDRGRDDTARGGRHQRRSAVMTTTESRTPPQHGHSADPQIRWRAVLLAAVAACAACGLVYERAVRTLSTSLNGGGVIATSLIVAGYIAALGAGALLVKPLLARAAIGFIAVETLLALTGGLSAAALYVAFS